MNAQLLCVLALVTLTGGQETIREQVKRATNGLNILINREFSPGISLSELAANSDLIARVAVRSFTSHLSEDEHSVASEIEADVIEAFFSNEPTIPGQAVTLTRLGGTIAVDGVTVTVFEPDFPPFSVGDEYILFLVKDPSTGHYLVQYGAQGAFKVSEGVVDQVAAGTSGLNRGRVPASQFLQELATSIRGLQK